MEKHINHFRDTKKKVRLIDAHALKRKFDEREADDVEMYGVHIVECFPADDAKEIVDEMPTVDAEEVVRCKNCDDYDEKYPGFGRCKYFDIGRTGNDFCSSGQRRDNG